MVIASNTTCNLSIRHAFLCPLAHFINMPIARAACFPTWLNPLFMKQVSYLVDCRMRCFSTSLGTQSLPVCLKNGGLLFCCQMFIAFHCYPPTSVIIRYSGLCCQASNMNEQMSILICMFLVLNTDRKS